MSLYSEPRVTTVYELVKQGRILGSAMITYTVVAPFEFKAVDTGYTNGEVVTVERSPEDIEEVLDLAQEHIYDLVLRGYSYRSLTGAN